MKPSTPLGAHRVSDETMRGVAPTKTVGEARARKPVSALQDVLTLFKVRVTSLVVLTSLLGFFLAARKSGVDVMTWKMVATLLGIGIVSSGAAALNQGIEWRQDGKMSRTKDRPVPSGRMPQSVALALGSIAVTGGCALLFFMTNPLTALLTFATAAAYVLVYTPLKMITPVSTLVGAFPGAMPPVLGWTAITGSVDPGALALFAILFFWQFPHFLAIAWLYRDDYERAGIKMRPVVDQTGRVTLTEILANGVVLIPVSLAPILLGMGHWPYAVAAVVLGAAYLAFGIRLARLRLPPTAASTKKYARQLLQASIIYLPLLVMALIANGAR
ncbi:MAG TPA: heme o synthase [Terriglobales bacterium]|nr:heme o synthase [Terriglobales bacterium]